MLGDLPGAPRALPAVLAVALVAAGCATTGDPAAPSRSSTAGPATAVPAPEALREIRQRVAELVDEEEVPSFALSVVREGEFLWEEGFGRAVVERDVAATAVTPYSLASVSKPITATGLMVLVERGLVDLDAPVNDYLGDQPLRARVGSADDATVRRVANHTAGLPLHYQFFWSDRDAARPPMPVTIGRWGNLVTAPGERYEYSNLGYGILEHVIERVSGQDYASFLRREVFEPLGMTASSVPLAPGLDAPIAHRYGEDGDRLPFYDFDHRGASAVYSSAHDLALFALHHLGAARPGQREILSGETVEEMQVGTAEVRPGTAYGVGWMVSARPDGRRVVGHGGGMGGVTTSLLLVPDEEVAVAVLMNARGPWPSRISDAILDGLLPPRADRVDAGGREGPAGRGAGRDGGGRGVEPPAPGPEETPGREQTRRRPGSAARAWDSLAGRWEGTVDDPLRPTPMAVALDIDAGGGVRMRVDGGPWMEMLAPRFRDGFLLARTPAGYDPDDPGRTPRLLQLDVKLRGDALNGSLTTLTRPPDRTGNALSSWIELARRR